MLLLLVSIVVLITSYRFLLLPHSEVEPKRASKRLAVSSQRTPLSRLVVRIIALDALHKESVLLPLTMRAASDSSAAASTPAAAAATAAAAR